MNCETQAGKAHGRGGFWGRFASKDHPREVALVGFTGSFLSWMVLLPLCVYCMFTGGDGIPKLLWLVVTVYFHLMAGTGYLALQRVDGGKGNRALAMLAGLFWPIAGLVFMPAMKTREGRLSGVTALGSLMCGVIGLLGGMPGAWVLIWACLVLLVLSISSLPIGGSIRLKGWIPLGIIVGYVVAVSIYRGRLEQQMDACEGELSTVVGQSILEDDFWQREAKGLRVNEEPMKTLMAGYKKSEAAADLVTLQREHGEFMKAMEALTSLPVRGIAHARPASGRYVDMTVPELPALVRASQVCALDLQARADQRKEVLTANARLENLRDRCLKTSSLVARLVGMDVEARRLRALTKPLALETLTPQDWTAILDPKVDWEQAFRHAIGDEATSLQGVFAQEQRLPDMMSVDGSDRYSSLLRSLFPLEMSVWSLRDHVFALTCLQDLSGLFVQGMSDAETQAREFEKRIWRQATRNAHWVSKSLLPALVLSVPQFAACTDRLEMLKLAVTVMAQREKEGRLTENLDFLATVPQSSLRGKPFGYEAGTLKVKLHSGILEDRCGFRIYVPEEGKKPYQVRVSCLVLLNKQ